MIGAETKIFDMHLLVLKKRFEMWVAPKRRSKCCLFKPSMLFPCLELNTIVHALFREEALNLKT